LKVNWFWESVGSAPEGGSRAALRRVFREGVRVAAANGLLGLICHAVERLAEFGERQALAEKPDRARTEQPTDTITSTGALVSLEPQAAYTH